MVVNCKFITSVIVVTTFYSNALNAQDEGALSDLFNLEITSASKKAEDRFESPLSTSVVTAQQIENSGVTTILEAMRLFPGVFSQQTTNGFYRYGIRGYEGLPPGGGFIQFENSTTLVMVNGRIVYNYYAGGAFWETLPIALSDIHQIELIRGPGAPLYGPNAVTGVINIITKDPADSGNDGLTANLNVGMFETKYGSISYSRSSEGFSYRISANGDRRERFAKEWWSWNYKDAPTHVDNPEDIVAATAPSRGVWSKFFPEPETAMDKGGAYIDARYAISDNSYLGFESYYQSSRAQLVYNEAYATNYSTRDSHTGGARLAYVSDGLNASIDHLTGFQDSFIGTADGWFYDMKTTDVNLEYIFRWDNIELRPGVNQRKASYEAEFIGGEKDLNLSALTLRTEYTPIDNWRNIIALRQDRYSNPDEPYLSYQFASTYKHNANSISRLNKSRSNGSSFIYNSYLDTSATVKRGPNVLSRISKGDPDLDLIVLNESTIGHREKLGSFFIDAEIFQGTMSNFVEKYSYTEIETDSTTAPPTTSRTGTTLLKKADGYYVSQQGITLSLEHISSGKDMKSIFFLTVQESKSHGSISDPNVKVGSSPGIYLPDNLEYKETVKSVPEYYGGMIMNYNVGDWNLNLTSYFSAPIDIEHRFAKLGGLNRYLVINSKIAKQVTNNVEMSLNLRNIGTGKQREYPTAEGIPMNVLFGLVGKI